MDWLWTWGGVCFGYRKGDELYARSGRHAGRFDEDQVFRPDGRYLGQMRERRLIVELARERTMRGRFKPVTGAPFGPYADREGRDLPTGFADFPHPETIR